MQLFYFNALTHTIYSDALKRNNRKTSVHYTVKELNSQRPIQNFFFRLHPEKSGKEQKAELNKEYAYFYRLLLLRFHKEKEEEFDKKETDAEDTGHRRSAEESLEL